MFGKDILKRIEDRVSGLSSVINQIIEDCKFTVEEGRELKRELAELRAKIDSMDKELTRKIEIAEKILGLLGVKE